jgi:hypothetical protein
VTTPTSTPTPKPQNIQKTRGDNRFGVGAARGLWVVWCRAVFEQPFYVGLLFALCLGLWLFLVSL